MPIDTMTMEQVEARLADINLDEEGADLEALNAEMDALEARKKEIIAQAEAKREELRAAAKNETIDTPIVQENNKMEDVRTFAIDTPEYRTAWLKNLAGQTLTAEERTAMSTVNVIPTITENTIINRLKENALLQYIDFTQYAGCVDIPVYSTNGDAAWSDTNEQQDAITTCDLNLYKLLKTVQFPAKFEKDGIDAFESKLVEALINKIESALQKAVIVGTGSSQATGINVTHSTADGTFTKAAITKADLLKIMGKLDAKYQKDAVWVMPSAVFYEAMGIANIQNFVNVGDDLQKRICGKPVVLDDNCVISSVDTIFYGCAKAYHLNLGAPIEVSRSADRYFEYDNIGFKAVCYADGKLDSSDAFVKYTRATA